MLIIVIRTLILYAVVIFSLRIMGKRQIGELQPSELVVAIMISDLATVPMESINIPLITGIIPVFTLILAEVMLSFAGLKSRTVRKIIAGSPSVVIYDGVINERELARMRFNLDDLLEELRLMGFFDISDVGVAVLETSGKISVIPKDDARTAKVRDLQLKEVQREGLPCSIIIDGKLNQYELKRSGKSLDFIKSEIAKEGAGKISDVFILSIDPEGNVYIQMKEKAIKRRKHR